MPVTNAGKVAGDEAVLWFIQDPYCSITRPERELKYFEKKHLEPGQTEVYTFEIDPIRDFGYVDADGHRFLETGEYRVLVGDKTITLNCVE